MLITDIRIKLASPDERLHNERILAYAKVTFDDCFVVRDFRVLQFGERITLASPSRSLKVHCPDCRRSVGIRDCFCRHCGAELPFTESPVNDRGRSQFHTDIAHPAHNEFRIYLEGQVVAAYLEALREPAAVGA